MIECSFCSTSKSERYLYTECGHLLCLNCAALRSSDNLQCCNIMTRLEEEVKAELREKKEKILNNLQNEYKYERTDVNTIGLTQIEERLRKIDGFENRSKRKYQQDLEPDMINDQIQQMKETPMNQFYKSPFILQDYKYEVPESTPIKMVSNTDDEDLIQFKPHQRSSFHPVSEEKAVRRQNEQCKRKQQNVKKSQFIPVLQKNIKFVRQEFKGLYNQLEKMQANIVCQMKIYFEEYVNLIEKENSNVFNPSQIVEVQMEQVDSFLDQFVQEWNLKDIGKLLSSKQGQISKNSIKESPKPTNYEMADKRQLIYSNQIQPLQSCRLNYPTKNQKTDPKDCFLDKLKFSQSLQTQNKIEPPAGTGRNLDKIYKKLQESRSKLQQRIQIHNEFMNKRCINLSSY